LAQGHVSEIPEILIVYHKYFDISIYKRKITFFIIRNYNVLDNI